MNTPLRLHAHQTGSGPTIVLLHGYLSSSQYFRSLRRRLARDHRVISVDLLGHGISPKDSGDYSLQAHIAALAHTLDQLVDGEKITLLGHSLGGLVSLGYAARFPGKVSKLVLINPPMFTNYEEARESIASTSWLYKTMLFSPLRHVLWSIFKLAPRPASRFRSRLSLSDFASVPKKVREQSLHDVIMTTNIFAELETITTPTFIIVGQRDRAIYTKNLAAWTVPSHVTVLVNKYGHQFTAFHPRKVEQTVRRFLDSND